MSRAAKFDGRRAKALEAELVRRAESVLRGDGQKSDPAPITGAILTVAARIGEEVTRRLDQTPTKQADNFYSAAGIGRDPARPATLPVAFKLVEGAEALVAPMATQLMVPARGPVVFETDYQIDLVPGAVAQLRGLDARLDAISIPSKAVVAAELPQLVTPLRRLRSGSAAGATKIQVDPAAGLQPNMLLAIGEGQSAREHLAVAVEGDLVTLDPPLETELAKDSPVREVMDFAPFATTTRNHQSHALYLGHRSLLDLPSEATILISGLPLPSEAEWSWWGTIEDDDEPDWQPLKSNQGLKKPNGKLLPRKVGAVESLWLRASLPAKSTGAVMARDVRMAIGGQLCGTEPGDRCGDAVERMNVGWAAIAANIPVVPNQPFHPFGREPRLYDTFYLGSDEVFAKVGAEVSICIDVAGADLGPLVGPGGRGARLFGVGTDGFLYRVQFDENSLPRLEQVPPPKNDLGTVFLKARSSLALWVDGATHHVAAIEADGGAVQIAHLADSAEAPKPNWRRLPLLPGKTVEKLAIARGGTARAIYALDEGDKELSVWTQTNEGNQPSTTLTQITQLVAIEGADNVLIIKDDKPASLEISIGGPGGAGPPTTVPRADMPERIVGAFHDDRNNGRTYIAGYDLVDSRFRLRMVEATNLGQAGPALRQLDTGQQCDRALPVSFTPGGEIAGGPQHFPPILTLATPHPMHVAWVEGPGGAIHPVVGYEPVSIGSSNNPLREVHSVNDRVVVQRPNVGLFVRPSPRGSTVEEFQFGASRGLIVAGASDFGAADRIIYFRNGRGVRLKAVGNPAGDRQVLDAHDPADPLPADSDQIFAMDLASPASPVTVVGSGAISLPDTGDPGGQRLRIDAEFAAGHERQIWRLERQSAANDQWPDPGLDPAKSWTFRELRDLAAGDVVTGQHAVLLGPNSDVLEAVADGKQVWRADNRDFAAIEPVYHGSGAAVAYPESAIHQGQALFMAATAEWGSTGPGQAANPALSWEYWNGESWWALTKDDQGLEPPEDRTANLTVSGGVFFKVPADIAATEVGGREMHWIRLRLVGGDYGEALVKEVSKGVFQRDTSTIAAPNIIGLKLGYCAIDPVRPEAIVTGDNLGLIDQTSANDAGLEFPVFTSLAELMRDPVRVASAVAIESCDDPCPDQAEEDPSPCDAPGAYDSCDNPCVRVPGSRGADANSDVRDKEFIRGLMIGFDQPFFGNAISLYVSAEPSGEPDEIIAEILHNGRFESVNVLQDGSSGLTEPGILTFVMPNAPDMSNLCGAVAYWLRLRPKRNPSNWSPRLYGIYLNGVLSRSVETRRMERLGASTAIDNQEFRLSEGPVLAGSLELRVREQLSDEEKQDLDIATLPFDLPGDWVRWTAEGDLGDDADAGRVFAFDAEQGVIGFGDGRTGRIPPLEADVVAVQYARVVGSNANGVAPGTAIPLLSPLAGVERVQALDYSAGGSDVEPLSSARRRAPAKLRHGGRILTGADVEDYALTLDPGIAQVRFLPGGGRQRLIIIMRGRRARPLPAQLREFAAAIREVAGYGLAREGGLEVIPPRLLPISIRLTLQPQSAARFGEAATKVGDRLLALFDPATGNHDGRGWPVGRLPEGQDIAAALSEIEPLALLEAVSIERADRANATERELPKSVPDDVLVRLDQSDIAFERALEVVA